MSCIESFAANEVELHGQDTEKEITVGKCAVHYEQLHPRSTGVHEMRTLASLAAKNCLFQQSASLFDPEHAWEVGLTGWAKAERCRCHLESGDARQ
jgi:hypothetical protein